MHVFLRIVTYAASYSDLRSPVLLVQPVGRTTMYTLVDADNAASLHLYCVPF